MTALLSVGPHAHPAHTGSSLGVICHKKSFLLVHSLPSPHSQRLCGAVLCYFPVSILLGTYVCFLFFPL